MNNRVRYHISPSDDMIPPAESLAIAEVKRSLLVRLGDLLFPYRGNKYPGRQEAMAGILDLAVSSYHRLAKPCGDKKLSVPVCERAAALCRAQEKELGALAGEFEREAARLKSVALPGRGFLAVRVRDDTGVLRNARWRGKLHAERLQAQADAAAKREPF